MESILHAPESGVKKMSDVQELTAIQRLMVRRFHPTALFIDLAGAIWVFYFFWRHEWVAALLTLALTRAVATASVWKKNPEALSQTTLGKIGLLHLHPVNLLLQLIGVIPLLYGLWHHSGEFILAGVSLIFLGHVFGWEKIDRKFGSQ